MCKKACIFSNVNCLSLSRFDEISEAVFEAGNSQTEKAEFIHFVWLTGESQM